MSTQKLEQITDLNAWKGRIIKEIGVITLNPEELSERYGLVFHQDYDNLDNYVASAFRLPSGTEVGFLRHDGSPDRTTEVYTPEVKMSAVIRNELVEAMGVTHDVFSWTPEED